MAAEGQDFVVVMMRYRPERKFYEWPPGMTQTPRQVRSIASAESGVNAANPHSSGG